MNCSEASRYLPVFADGELSVASHQQVTMHLANCRTCPVEVDRWKALRLAVHRVFESTALPAGLEERVRVALRHARAPSRHRTLKLFGTIAAAAAVILLTFTFWPRSAQAALDPHLLAQVYRKCAVDHRHDGFEIRGLPRAEALNVLASCTHCRAVMPNLAERGYVLDGACGCLRVNGVRAAHVFYRTPDPDSKVISVFSIDKPVDLAGCRECTHGGCGGGRVFQDAVDGEITIVKWDEGGACYAMCGDASEEELHELAESTDVAALFTDRPILAASYLP